MQYVEDIEETSIIVSTTSINSIIGQSIRKDKIVSILTSLGFKVKNSNMNTLSITIPNFRHDIINIADIAEEVVRIVGIDNIKAKPLLIEERRKANATSKKLTLINKIRSFAVVNGFFETITYVFAQRDMLEKYNLDMVENKKDILNPITVELNTFRTTLALNLLNAVSHNVRQDFKSIALFELGVIFDNKRNESKSLGFIFSGESENPNLSNSGKPKNIDFFEFSSKIASCIGDFKLEPLPKIPNKLVHPFVNGTILIDKKAVGIIYKIHPNIASDFDISSDTFIAEIDFDNLLDDLIMATSISKFQSSKRDLSIIVPKDMQFLQIKNVINSLNIKEIKQFNLIDIYSDENDKELKNKDSLTIKFVLQSKTKTLQDDDINTIMDQILTALNKKLNIGLR
jgi:phenylalanyl-tRNA synthetase beta chain